MRVFGLIVVPYALASFVAVLSAADSPLTSAEPDPCAELTIDYQLQTQDAAGQWGVQIHGRYKSQPSWGLHVFAVAEDETFFWYGNPVHYTLSTNEWRSQHIPFGESRAIYTVVVALRHNESGPPTPGKTLIEYWKQIATYAQTKGDSEGPGIRDRSLKTTT